jgi:hypothetical protein
MPNKPRLQWVSPPIINGMRHWAAIDGAWTLLIIEEKLGEAYSASIKDLTTVDPASHRFSTDPKTGGLLVVAQKPMPPPAVRAEIIGVEGLPFASLEDAQHACEVAARKKRRSLS